MTQIVAHASCVVLSEKGVLIRGAPGSGKSMLGGELVSRASATGGFSAFIADDRVVLEPCGNRLVASAPAPLKGLWERRGEGIARIVFEPFAVIRLVVDLVAAEEVERMPEEGGNFAHIEGIVLPLMRLPMRMEGLAARRILRWVREGPPSLVDG